ncbi:hypothetical protein [Streptomyces sp. NPDC055992]|uniref:hypothetical protein n=1 Tax=Streptomyces sp. NPDC055992 TaxID=3345673 RepID=UPI0035D78D14
MALDLDNPHVFSVFVILHPDQLRKDTYEKPATLLELTSIGAQPYMTLPLTAGVEMHHCPGDLGTPNKVAAALAASFGHENARIHGPVQFTGESGETDLAPGMEPETFCDLRSRLNNVCRALGLRMWRQLRPSDRVSIRYDDLTPGDTCWILNEAHRFRGLRDLPAGSPTRDIIPHARTLLCDDGFKTIASGEWFMDRADRAPAGYWQRTGNQLLPADD